MKRIIPLSFLLLACLMAQGQVKLVRLAELQNIINSPSNEVKVINFWATWCAPCIKELPLFEKLTQSRTDVKVTLVSMDIDLDPNPDKVNKFVARKKLKSDVVILNETNPNDWIDKIEKEWSGAIPATLVINTKTGKRKFVEKELHDGDLEKLIEEVNK
jgi:thiol-disulfide isomerase/thioredoxin